MTPRRVRPALAAVRLAVLLIAVGACVPTVIAPGPAVGAAELGTDAFIAADGARLPLRTWSPAGGPPTAVVVAVHGFNDYGNFFDAAGTYLAARGIASYAFDQRGFGAAPQPGLWFGTETMAADLRAVTAAVRSRHQGVPVHILGMSMGGAVALVAMTGADPPDVDGVILVAPAVWARSTMPWYQRAGLWLAAHTLPWITVSGRGLERVPSDNREMLKALGRDPLVIKESRIDALHGLVGLMDAAFDAARRFDAPSLILYGTNDQIMPIEPTRQMFASLPDAPDGKRRVAIYEGGYHMLLRGLRAETVWRDIAAWIADPAAPLPSGAGGRLPAPEPLR